MNDEFSCNDPAERPEDDTTDVTSDPKSHWADLLRAANAGDETAYRRLLGELAPWLRAIARNGLRRAGRGDAEAEDVVQDTLIAIHLKRHTWEPTRDVMPWLRAITRHKLIDHLRRRRIASDVPLEDLEEIIAAPSDEPQLAQSDILKLAEELPKGQRAVVHAMFVENRSTRETAESLSMSEGAVRVALHRALTTLGELFRREERA